MNEGAEMSLLKGPWAPVPQLLVIPTDPKLSHRASLPDVSYTQVFAEASGSLRRGPV